MKNTIVLILEDDEFLRQLILEKMAELGCHVVEAANGEGGLAYVRQTKPDLIISDMVMPKMNGYEFLKAIRELENGKDVPFISTSALPGTQQKFEGMDFVYFMEKPFAMAKLVGICQTIIAGKKE